MPSAKIIVLSMHSDRGMVLEALRTGASGYLLKDCATDELERAIRTVLAGKTYVSPDIAGLVVNELRTSSTNQNDSEIQTLTGKEREVLQLLAEGKSCKDIAFTLNLSPKTVDVFRFKIMKKLGIDNIAELTKYAIREGLTSLES